MDGRVYRDGYCNMQPWAWAASYCSTYVNSALHPFGVAKLTTSFIWGKGGNVTSAGWQVKLWDPIWHMSSCSNKAGLLTKGKLLYCIYLLFLLLYIGKDRKHQYSQRRKKWIWLPQVSLSRWLNKTGAGFLSAHILNDITYKLVHRPPVPVNWQLMS